MKKISEIVSVLAVSALPVAALAVNPTTARVGDNVNDLFTVFSNLANRSIGILVTIALAVFFWGLVQYLFKLGAGKGEHGRDLMMYGIIALFVMVSVWGIIQFIGTFFGLTGQEGIGTTNLIPKTTTTVTPTL